MENESPEAHNVRPNSQYFCLQSIPNFPFGVTPTNKPSRAFIRSARFEFALDKRSHPFRWANILAGNRWYGDWLPPNTKSFRNDWKSFTCLHVPHPKQQLCMRINRARINVTNPTSIWLLDRSICATLKMYIAMTCGPHDSVWIRKYIKYRFAQTEIYAEFPFFYLYLQSHLISGVRDQFSLHKSQFGVKFGKRIPIESAPI